MGPLERLLIGKVEGYDLPKLQASGFRVTSCENHAYNCIAWAVREETAWWEPTDESDDYRYWPDGVPAEQTIPAYVAAIRTKGFEVCEDGSLESGFEKIALYADEYDIPKHAARQLASGAWTSKLGYLEDVEHPSVEDVAGEYYGEVVRYLKRAIPAPAPSEGSTLS